MKPVIIEDYIEKIYGYAVNHTYTHDEADEMSQEILLMVLRNLPKLRVDSKFEPWLWGVANNVAKSFRRSMGKNRATYSYDVLENVPFHVRYGVWNVPGYESIMGCKRNKSSFIVYLFRRRDKKTCFGNSRLL